MSLFQLGEFILHSGDKSEWKIDCDELSDGSLMTAAYLLSKKLQPFNYVIGIPKGGIRFANMFREFESPQAISSLLLVDDVLTTGGSLLAEYHKHKDHFSTIQGVVIFDRCEQRELYGNTLGWIRPFLIVK